MKLLILNSGLGSRMGDITKDHPKCMTEIGKEETILSRQLKLAHKLGIKDIIMTTGYYDEVLIKYCHSLSLPLKFKFVNNPHYKDTNYIYSIYCARNELYDDIVLMHGDLVFDESVLRDVLNSRKSCMKVSSTIKLPDKDFKAVVKDGRVYKIGIEFFDSAMEAQALYKLSKKDWEIWLKEIITFCENGNTKVYAENAFNQVSDKCEIYALDVKNQLCTEIDTPEDLAKVKEMLKNE